MKDLDPGEKKELFPDRDRDEELRRLRQELIEQNEREIEQLRREREENEREIERQQREREEMLERIREANREQAEIRERLRRLQQ